MLAVRLPLANNAIMADAVEAFGQHVEEELPDELVGMQYHRLPPFGSVDAVVLQRKATPLSSVETRRRLEMAMRWVYRER